MSDGTTIDEMADDGLVGLPTVAQAIAAAATAVGPIAKDQIHGTGTSAYRYRGIEQIMEQAGPALREAGVTFLPNVLGWEYREVLRGDPPKPWRLITATVAYTIVGPRGDSLAATVVAEGLDNGDKAAAKVMTMAYKSCLLQVLGIGDAAHDTDAGHDYPEPSGQGTARRAPGRTTKKASKTTKKAAPPKATPEEQVQPLIEKYGAEHAAAVAALIGRLDSLPVGPERGQIKAAFVEAFGKPAEVPPDDLDVANAWVALAVSLGAVPTGDDLPPKATEPASEPQEASQPTPAPDGPEPCVNAGKRGCDDLAVTTVEGKAYCKQCEPF